MKKLLAITSLATLLAQLSTFGQGYAAVAGGARSAWDGFTQPTSRLAATMNVAILWGSGTPLISSIAASTPTNTSLAVGFSRATAWSDILNDPNFQFAVDNNTSTMIIPQTSAGSSWTYTTTGGFSSIPITGTSAGSSYSMFVIGWDKTYATPQAAGAAGAYIGWSAPFTYHFTDSIGTPPSIAASGFIPFGVVPEPGSLSLIGLGAASALLFRRRK